MKYGICRGNYESVILYPDLALEEPKESIFMKDSFG